MRLSPLFPLALLALPVVAHADEFKAKKASDDELVACLERPEAELRIECAEYIARRGLSGRQDALVQAAKADAAPLVRLAALEALRDLGTPGLVIAASHMAIEDAVTSNRAKALGVIEKDCGDESAPVVVRAMADADATIARKAVIIVGKRGFSEGEPWLVQSGVTHGEPAVVEQAWKTLTVLGNPDLRPQIHQALASGNESVRKAIARAMRDTVLPADKQALIGALDDANTHVARDAAKALVALGDASVAPILREKAASAADPSVQGDFEKSADALEGL
jgi:HEAT repeat protein